MITEGLGLNRDAKEVVKEYVIKKMVMLLTEAECDKKIREDQEVLEKVSIKLTPSDIHPLIEAIQKSEILNEEYEQVSNGGRVEKYFAILADLLAGTDILAYYNKFSKVKLSKPAFSDFQFVSIALKILDYNNWANNELNDNTKEATRKFFLRISKGLELSGADKLYNLNVLQQELNISLSQAEEDSLISNIKQTIMGSVDLIDQLKRTDFGVKGFSADAYVSQKREEKPAAVQLQPEPEPEEVAEPEAEESGKKGFRGIFGKK